MLHGLTGWHLLIVLAVIVLLFGAAKLPALAQSVGTSARLFRRELKAMKDDDDTAPADVAPVVAAPAASTRTAAGADAVAVDPPTAR